MALIPAALSHHCTFQHAPDKSIYIDLGFQTGVRTPWTKGTCNNKKKHNVCISELGHLNLASQLFISPLNIKNYYVFKNLNSLQSHQSQQHQSILSFSENQTTCLWSECRRLEKNSASCPLKKKKIWKPNYSIWHCLEVWKHICGFATQANAFHFHMWFPVTYKTSQERA